MISEHFKKDLQISIEIVWTIYSIIIIGILGMIFFLPETFLNVSPVCVSKSQFGSECFICGMTRAFIEISKGNFYNANVLNKISIYSFTLAVLNSITFIYYLLYKIRVLLKLEKSVSYL